MGKIKYQFNKRMCRKSITFRDKIIGNYLILLIIPIILYYILLVFFFKETKAEEMILIQQLNNQAAESIDSYLNGIEYLTKQPLYSNEILQILKLSTLRNSNTRLGVESGFKRNISFDEGAVIDGFTSQLLNYSESIYSVFIYNVYGDVMSYAISVGDMPVIKSVREEAWFTDSILGHGLPVISCSEKLANVLYKRDNYGIPVSRALVDLDGVDPIGVIAITSSEDFIDKIVSKSKFEKGELLYIINDKGDIIYDMDKKGTAQNISVVLPGVFHKGGDKCLITAGNVRINDNGYIVMTSEIKDAKWHIVRIIPQDALDSKARKTQGKLFLLITSFTLLSLIISVVLSSSLTRPIKKLIGSMRLIEKGDFTVRLNVKSRDEIGQLCTSFNTMIAKIKKLIEDNYITNLRKKEAELNALQAQINPHFVYNTLESIRMLAEMSENNEISDSIFALGKLMRYNINIKDQKVSIGEEIEHLKSYLMLQNMRFNNKFGLQLEIPEELYQSKIIKLVLQPIVENSICHAFESMEGRGIIKIKCYRNNEFILIDIEDNGIGMNELQMEELNRKTNDFTNSQKNSPGIGLKNVNERIKLYFGDSYGVWIYPRKEAGILVRIQIPNS